MIYAFIGGMLAFMALVINLNCTMDAKMIKLQIALLSVSLSFVAYAFYIAKFA